jgi:hypothetical protein
MFGNQKMKRSEALKLITDIISEVTYENLAEKRAEKVLSALEDAGMAAPSFSKRLSCGCCSGYFENEWEPEL